MSKKGWLALIGGLIILGFGWLVMSEDDWEDTGDSAPYEANADADADMDADSSTNGDGYTILVYMNGSDLESEYDEESGAYYGAATADIVEMIDGLSHDGIQLIIETGGTAAWGNELISADINQRWKVEDGELLHLADVGQRNMGEAETLTDFITWGMDSYPSNNYALLFWNHGGGAVLGFGADEHYDGDSLTLDEIGYALEAAYHTTNEQFELIGFDACLMATVETAHMLSPYGRYLVASEELEPGHGWDYTSIMSALSDKPGMNGRQLGVVIADSYRAHAEAYGQDKNITLSVTDLSQMDNVVAALEAFIEEAQGAISVDSSSFYRFANGRSLAEDYGSSSGQGSSTDMVDLLALVRNVSKLSLSTGAALEAALQEAVAYNINSAGRPAASGLSIYFPHKDKDNFASNLAAFEEIGFSETYTAFLHNYVTRLKSNTSKVAIVQSNELEVGYNEEEDEYAPYEVYIDPDDLERIEQIFAVVSMYADDSSSTLIYLGYDHYVNVDWDTGVIQDAFTGEWLMWEDNFVTLELVNQGEDYVRYAIPVKLNGKEMDVLVHFDIETETFDILGAWAGISETTGMPDKNLIQLKDGDVIIPQYYYYDEYSDEDGYVDGEAFTITGDTYLEYADLPLGSYLYGFSIVDYSGNETLTDFIEFVLEE